MSSQRPEREKPSATSRRMTPKPTLMESYSSAFNDDHLKMIVSKIRSITGSAADPPEDQDLQVQEPASTSELPSIPLDHPIDQSVDQPVHQPTGQSTNESTKWSDDTSIQRPIEKSNEWSNQRGNERPNEEIANCRSPKNLLLNENQAILYYCLRWLQGRTTSLQRIGQATGISAFTLKHCLRKLRDQKAIIYHGRRNSVGRVGFAADALSCEILLRGSEHRLRQRLEEIHYERLPIVRAIDTGLLPISTESGPSSGLMNEPLDDRKNGLPGKTVCSSKEQLLQDLLLENAFENLNPQSLLPHLAHIETVEALQDFLDMANACVAAAHATESPIRNPHGFLIAQLKAGFINPPEGYKSRRIQAQEKRNRQLEVELEELRRLKAAEDGLVLEVFRAKLTGEEEQQLLREAQARVNPSGMLSENRQLEMAKDDILRAWFKERNS